mmetsp:Transcript_31669/g.104961  ORF Transcript_31669/g.104961 Transcript_31669/m.104961 type:complete len:361 (+) Transcript_31669:500-1582(+)
MPTPSKVRRTLRTCSTCRCCSWDHLRRGTSAPTDPGRPEIRRGNRPLMGVGRTPATGCGCRRPGNRRPHSSTAERPRPSNATSPRPAARNSLRSARARRRSLQCRDGTPDPWARSADGVRRSKRCAQDPWRSSPPDCARRSRWGRVKCRRQTTTPRRTTRSPCPKRTSRRCYPEGRASTETAPAAAVRLSDPARLARQPAARRLLQLTHLRRAAAVPPTAPRPLGPQSVSPARRCRPPRDGVRPRPMTARRLRRPPLPAPGRTRWALGPRGPTGAGGLRATGGACRLFPRTPRCRHTAAPGRRWPRRSARAASARRPGAAGRRLSRGQTARGATSATPQWCLRAPPCQARRIRWSPADCR